MIKKGAIVGGLSAIKNMLRTPRNNYGICSMPDYDFGKVEGPDFEELFKNFKPLDKFKN